MKNSQLFPITLIAVAILSGCNAMPQNSSVAAAHQNYSRASSDPQVSNLAAAELKDAGETLGNADEALSKGESTVTVNHLAYLASQKVAIAQETAKQKAAEIAVTNASIKRNEVRLDARTAEADTAKQQVLLEQETAAQQASALSAASAKSERDETLISQQKMQLQELNARKTDRGMVITLGDVLFSVNKSNLKSGEERNIQKLADFLNLYPQHRVLVEGYTDSKGSKSLNKKLSEHRANSVRMALIEMGISGDRITMHGYGEKFPVADNDTSSSRQLNRRVEIIISDASGKITPR